MSIEIEGYVTEEDLKYVLDEIDSLKEQLRDKEAISR
jgi:hypothetical protein